MKTKRHLTIEIVLLICILASVAVLVCWLVNALFLERYYVREKESVMVTDFDTMSRASAYGMLEAEEFDATFASLCENGNMSVMVIDDYGLVLRTSAADLNALQEELDDIVRGVSQADTMQEGMDYVIFSMQDERVDAGYLVLVGTLPAGETILMRTALESIRESAALSNRMLLIVGLTMIVISSLLGWILARRITRPIQQLTDISQQMVGLDFEAKYVPGAWRRHADARPARTSQGEEVAPGNEIDLLGARMNQLSETLEQTISELKSANAELTRDIETKTQIDEMRQEFLSNVSHELKTPIALVQGYAEGLEAGINEDDPESRAFYCDVIIDEAAKMNRMVQQLLALTQLESGGEQVVMERFDITEMIRGVVSASSILMEKEGITLDMDGLDSQYIWGDTFGVEEVITNYVSNAIHHCAGEKKIRIFYTKRDGLLRVSVYNTGEPIPEEDIDQIWDKFYKVDKARTREYGGSGIGLSIVKAVMDAHGQRYGAENHPDGVEFWAEWEMQ